MLALSHPALALLRPECAAETGRYTKRALLAGVIAITEVFMITDFSPGYADTWASLDRRLRDVTQIGKAASQVHPVMSSGGGVGL